MTIDDDDLDVGHFLASPRHAFHFATDASARAKIAARITELERSGRIAGKTPIVNRQSHPEITELHDGNASVVAWLCFAERARIATSLGILRRSFDRVIVLHDRLHDSGEPWHPFVPEELRSAERLRAVVDEEQGRQTRLALTLEGEAVYFDDRRYFDGDDAARPLREIAREFERAAGR